MMARVWRAAIGMSMAVGVLGCAASDGRDAAGVTTSEMATSRPIAASTSSTGSTEPAVSEPGLRRELLAMMAEDQAEQTGQAQTNNYTARTERLAEILDEHGWPSFDLVGEDGSTAAWVIAQHADLDLDLQRRALELLRAAAAAGKASGGDLAYLEDRVAVASGQPQQYGTQMGCAEDLTPITATPIADQPSVDGRRAEAGLPPLADYIEEMTAICAGAG